jgi:hypothetical protein
MEVKPLLAIPGEDGELERPDPIDDLVLPYPEPMYFSSKPGTF